MESVKRREKREVVREMRKEERRIGKGNKGKGEEKGNVERGREWLRETGGLGGGERRIGRM